jgi:hypothetical protein
MLVEQDRALADDSSPDDAIGEPRVLVIYRSRGVPWLLLPPLLILSSVAAIVVYRRSERTEAPTPPAVASVVLAKTTSEVIPPVITGSSSANVETAAKVTDSKPPENVPVPSQNPTLPLTPPITSTTPPPGSGEPSAPAVPFDPAPLVVAKAEQPPAPTNPPSPPERVGFDPGALQAEHALGLLPPPPDDSQTVTNPPVPESPPLIIVEKPVTSAVPPLIPDFVAIPAAKVAQVEKPRTEDAQADINREAELQGARRRELAALKPELVRGNPRERQAQRDEIAAVARRQEAEKRGPFHTDLRQILREQGRNGGREIQTLCERYGTEYPPEIFEPLTRDLTGPATRMTVPARVDRMRRWGLPETLVLDDLYLKEESRINSPGGPRTRDEAWVFAARRLLTMPPPPAPPRPAAQPSAQPPPMSPPAQ